MKLKLAIAVATVVASGAVFAQNTPAKQDSKNAQKTQVAQSKGGQSAGAGQTAPPAPAFAGFGLAPTIAATLTLVGAAASNETSPPNH